jgi:ATP-dependent DNA helicase 2 subunit 1
VCVSMERWEFHRVRISVLIHSIQKQKKNPNEFDGLYVFMDLDVPDAQRILSLESLLSKFTPPFAINAFHRERWYYRELWTHGKRVSILRCSMDVFYNVLTMVSILCDYIELNTSISNVKVGHKRIFLFTNDDNPNAEDEALRARSLQRARDLEELGIDIELFSMNQPGKQFDPSLFYQVWNSNLSHIFIDFITKNIITFDTDEYTGQINFDAADKFEELRARVRRKEFKKRSLSRLGLFIGDGIEIAVRLYEVLVFYFFIDFMQIQTGSWI